MLTRVFIELEILQFRNGCKTDNILRVMMVPKVTVGATKESLIDAQIQIIPVGVMNSLHQSE